VGSAASLSERVLILVPGARDQQLTTDLLRRDGLEVFACQTVAELCTRMEEGGAVILLTEEVLTRESLRMLSAVLRRQPPWSDFPVAVFSSARGAVHREADDIALTLGNVTFLDRPVRPRSMLAAVYSAIRSRRRQYEARRAIESRDTFLAMLGHELRNPLGAIRLAVAMLEKRLPQVGQLKEHAVIERQSRHLARLVDDLLDVARVTHGKVTLKPARLNLVEVVRSAFEVQDARAREHRVAYSLRLPPAPLWVDGDRQRLEQVFANLLTNAIKYTPAGGSVDASVRLEGDLAVMSVADTGVGIAPDMLAGVFDTFAQVGRTLDRAEGGIGLGLALVRSIVQLHRGTVEASSGGPGKGSEFVVRLPVVAAPVDVASAPSVVDQLPALRRVVVVEDSADIRELLAELLAQEGHEVSCAEDGPQGLEKILALAPDIAFVDLGLPGFDGYELARRARASGSRARLVAVTGYGQPADRQEASDAGFDDHLTKPVVESDLHGAMQRLA
jgi:signal transduction histidine kinase